MFTSWSKADEAADEIEVMVVGCDARTGFKSSGRNPDVVVWDRSSILDEDGFDVAPSLGYGLRDGLERHAVFQKEFVQQRLVLAKFAATQKAVRVGCKTSCCYDF